MKIKAFSTLTSAFVAAALSTLSASAASTNTWVGNTDANWSTVANWSYSSGSGPVASGDSLVFGAAGTAGASLNNDIAGLSINNLTFSSGASSFTFGGNGFTNGTGGIDASALTSGTETISGVLTLGKGIQRWNVGAGATLSLGNIGVLGGDATDTYGAVGAIAFLAKTGTIKTTVANGWGWRGATGHTGPGLLGPGMVLDNGNSTYDWAASTGSSPFTIAGATYTTANTGDANNVKVTANTSVNVNGSWASVLVSNATLTINGTQLYIDTGIILDNGGTIAGSKPIKANSDGLYIYTPDSGTISLSIQNNGSNAKLLYKAGSGTLSLTGVNSYSAGTMVDQGTLSVGNASALGSGALTLAGGNLDCSVANLTHNSISQNWNADFTFVGSQNLNLGNGTVTLNATHQVTVITNTLTVGGINDGGMGYGLTKAGNGTLKLGGANSYSGLTAVNGGAVMVANTTQANGPVRVADGAAAGVVATADATYWSPSSLTVGSSTGGTLRFNLGGSITGPNANVLLTPTSLTLNGATTIVIESCPQVLGSYALFNGYTSGALTLGSQPAGVLGTITTSGSTVYYQVTNFVTAVWTAAVNTNWDTVTANWTNTIGGNKYVSGYPVLFDDTAIGASPLLVNITNPVTPNSMIVNNTNKAYVIGGLAIGGATGLTKNGNNTLTLTGTNMFAGDIVVSAGTLEIGGAGQMGGGSYAGNIAVDGTVKNSTTAAQTFSGTISGAGSLIQAGTNTLTLSAANTFSGGATISNGIVNLGDNNGLGNGTVTLDGGTVQNAAGITMANNVQVGTGGTIKLGATSDFWINGNVSGAGNLTLGGSSPGVNSLNVNFSGNSMSGGSITIPLTGPNQTVVRFKSAASGNANIPWSVGGAPDRYVTLDFGAGTIEFGALTGAGVLAGNGAGTKIVQVGGMNTNSTFDGKFLDGSGVVALTKVGNGNLTLTGVNAFSGGVNINGGNLCVSNTSALASSGAINFGGGTLQYSAANQADYSGRITNSASPISVDVNGTNVTFASALPAANTGGLALTNSTGTGVLTLTANNLYTGTTMINAGTLALNGSGNIDASTNITVDAGATFDVSGVANYTLGASQTLLGSGTVTGAVTTASVGSFIAPGGVGTVGTLTFNNNLNLSSGGSPVFDLSTSAVSGNDQIVVGGNLTLNGGDVIHVNALGGTADLDQTADYVLFSVVGTTTLSGHPAVVYDNGVPGNFNHYRVVTSGNNVVLRYSSVAAPIIASVVVTNTADGSTVGTHGQSVTVFVAVQPGTTAVTNVTADLSQLGGSAAQSLTSLGGNQYSYTLLLGPAAIPGTDAINVTATDTTPLTGSGFATFTVNALVDTWNGLALDDNWSSATNWVGDLPPAYAGDTVIFTGSTRTTPVMDNNYSIAGLTFDGAASSFTLGASAGKTLTLTGGVTNDSYAVQTLNLPVTFSGTQTVADDNGAGITLAGNISGAGGLTIANAVSGNPLLTLAGSNSYTGDTVIPLFAKLVVGNSAAIPSGSGAGNVSLVGTLDLNGTNATLNVLTGAGTVDNSSSVNASILTVGANNQSGTFSGTIQNSGGTNLSLVKVGTGSLSLGSANSFSGGMTISNGTVQLSNGGGLGTGDISMNGGTLQNTAAITITNNIVSGGGGTISIPASGGQDFTLSGNLSGTGPLTLGGGGPIKSLNISFATNTLTGNITIPASPNQTVVRFKTTTAGSATAAWAITGDTTTRFVTLDFVGTLEFGALSGPAILAGNGVGMKNLSVGALGTDTTFSGSIRDGSGTASLTKVGAGTLTLSGANTYTGPTVVSNGVLVITTAHTGNGDFVVNDSKKLGVINNGGSAAMGSLTLGDSAGQATLFFTNVSSTSIPIVTVAGGVTNIGPCNIAISNSVVNTGGVYPLVKYGSVVNPGAFVLASVPAGVTATLTNDTSNLWLALAVSVGNKVNTNPTNITSVVNGNQLILSWPTDHTGWRLQVQTNSLSTGLGTNWVDVPNTSTANSYTNVLNPTNGSVFYRMVYP